MNKRNTLQEISDALQANDLAKAENLLQQSCEEGKNNSLFYYLKGKLYMKRSQWGKAMSAFMQSENINPNGPATECRLMLEDIMAFYNKDMYNQ